MPRFLILPAADRDLDERAEYLAEHGSLEVALRCYDAARRTNPSPSSLEALARAFFASRRIPLFAGVHIWRIIGFEKHLILPPD